MAKFKLGLLIQDIDQTNNNQLKYIEDIFTNFNFDDYYFHYEDVRPLVVNKNQEENYKTKNIFLPTTAVNNNIFFSYSYDESLTLKEHSQKQLQFKMLKYVQHNSDFLINPYAAQITNGTLIILYDKFNNISYFIITKISYSIKNANVEISYEAQDLFSYIHTRQNSGYTITNDETKENFIGALTIDEWTNKIVDECKIAYHYLPLTLTIYKGYKGNTYEIKEIPQSDWDGYTILREPVVSDYNAAVTFSVSNSNALNALIQLAEQRGLNIQVDDKTKTFYYIPAKAEEFSGLYYSPQIDISDLSVSQQAQSLTTILNVTGQTLNNREITLLPSVPSMFLTLFSSERWKNEKYRPGFFQDFVKNQKVIEYTYTPSTNSGDDIYFTVDSSDYITQLHFQNQKVPFGNYTQLKPDSHLIIYISNNTIYTLQDCYDKEWIDINDSGAITFSGISTTWDSESDDFYLYNITNPQQATLQTFDMTINFNSSDMLLKFEDIKGVNASVIFKRTPTVEEEEFAKMADKLPWLENKLINVDYFYRHQLLSQNDYSLLLNTLYNELRITNGQLIYYNNLYYATLLNKTNIMAELQNAINVYMADFTYSMTRVTDDTARDRASQDLQDLYNFITFDGSGQSTTTLTKSTLLTLEKTLEQYINNYVQYEQIFFKNIYKFKEKWQDKVYFTLEGTSNGYYQNFTLGGFYEFFKASSQEPIIQQQAALIGTELQEYWNAAYTASQYCGWCLPESFEDSFYQIYDRETYELKSAWLPSVGVYEENGINTFDQGHINVNLASNWELYGNTGPRQIYGSDIWNDGNNNYYFSSPPYQSKFNLQTYTWENYTWTGALTSFRGRYVWTDGINIFYSDGTSNQYKLNKITNEWELFTWQYQSGINIIDINAAGIWNYNNTVYYFETRYSPSWIHYYYKLNKETYTWEEMNWNFDSSIYTGIYWGQNIWTDDKNIYYSEGDGQYQLLWDELKWIKIQWNISSFTGHYIWKDFNNNIFYSSFNNQQYKFNRNTGMWEKQYWGQTINNFTGPDIWYYNNEIIVSRGQNQQYRLKSIENHSDFLQIESFSDSSHNPIIKAFDPDFLILDDRTVGGLANNNFIHFLSWTPYTSVNKINYYTYKGTGGTKWNDLKGYYGYMPAPLNDTRLPIGGIWVILIHILLNKYYPQELTELEEVTENHNNIWRKLYQNFGNYLLENSYTDSLATNSEDLYNATMTFFKDQCTPEKSYDLSIIDIYALKGYTGQEVKVTDQIRIASQDFYQELDELKDILDQILFIKEIQYKLRSDTDIKLSVNIVQYQDKMIKRLVKLIR